VKMTTFARSSRATYLHVSDRVTCSTREHFDGATLDTLKSLHKC
jgi:hypothetical protein